MKGVLILVWLCFASLVWTCLDDASGDLWRSLRFRIGLVTNTAVGPLIDVAAYSFAPQSLVAPFGGLLANDGKRQNLSPVSVSVCVDLF